MHQAAARLSSASLLAAAAISMRIAQDSVDEGWTSLQETQKRSITAGAPSRCGRTRWPYFANTGSGSLKFARSGALANSNPIALGFSDEEGNPQRPNKSDPGAGRMRASAGAC